MHFSPGPPDLWLLLSLCPCLLWRSLSLGKILWCRCSICGWALKRCLPLDQLWVSLLTVMHWTKRFLWWKLRDALICRETLTQKVALLLCPLSNILLVGSALGPMSSPARGSWPDLQHQAWISVTLLWLAVVTLPSTEKSVKFVFVFLETRNSGGLERRVREGQWMSESYFRKNLVAFIHLMCAYVCMCASQRTACWSLFPSSPCGTWGLHSGYLV